MKNNATQPTFMLIYALICVLIMALGALLSIGNMFLGFPNWCDFFGDLLVIGGLGLVCLPLIGILILTIIDKIKKQKSGISVNIGKVTGNENEHLAKGLMRKYRNYFLKKDGCFKLPLMFKAVRNDSSNKNKILEFTVNTI